MATLTVFGDASDGGICSESPIYLTARAGSGSFQTDSVSGFLEGDAIWAGIGQLYDFSGDNLVHFQEGFIGFDTSSLAGATVSAASLSLYDSDHSFSVASAFVMQARSHDWGVALTAGDFVAGADLSGKMLLAHLASSSRVANQYQDFVDDALPANLNLTGFTRMVLALDLMEAGTAPGIDTYNSWAFTSADAVGTTQDPKLVITYTDFPLNPRAGMDTAMMST